MMSHIRARDTGPEMTVRRTAHRLGHRYRLQRRDLPGTPDLVFPSMHKVLFVHGCFWHRHSGCRFAYEPKSNVEFWRLKFATNIARDERVRRELERMGWEVLTFWECEVDDKFKLVGMLETQLTHVSH